METATTYSDRMQQFVTDPEIAELDKKYSPFLELHSVDDIIDVFDIIQSSSNETATAKLIWTKEVDLPINLKKDLTRVFEKHFTSAG